MGSMSARNEALAEDLRIAIDAVFRRHGIEVRSAVLDCGAQVRALNEKLCARAYDLTVHTNLYQGPRA